MHKLVFLTLTGVFWIVLHTQHVMAQDDPSTDSLLLELQKAGTDNDEKLRQLNALFTHLEYTDPSLARDYMRRAIPLAEKSRNIQLKALSFHNAGKSFILNDSGPAYLLKAAELYQNTPDSLKLPHVYFLLGKHYTTFGQFNPALEYYQQALNRFKHQGNKDFEAEVMCDMGTLYSNMANYELSFKYSSKSLEMLRELNDSVRIAFALIPVTEYYFYKDDTAKIFSSIKEAVQLFHDHNYPVYESYMLSNLGDAYMDYRHEYDSALQSLFLSLELIDSVENELFYINSLRKIGRAYDLMGEYHNALEYAKRAVANTDTSNHVSVQYNALLLTYIYISLKDSENAIESLEQYRSMTDEMHSREINEKISDLEVLYQTREKEDTIQILQKEKKITLLYLWGLTIILVFVSVGAYLLFRHLRDKHTIAEQKLKIREQEMVEMEKDRQLLASNSLLEGEETERRRIARDLHDGLGGLLSGVKFSLNNVKSNYVTNDKGAREYEHAVNLLDNSISELRRIAHNMMPESLVRLGLHAALTDFCNQIDHKNNCRVHYRFYGQESAIPQKYEIALYRIAQELINNALKYSGGSEIMVQVVNDDPRLSLTVQDNGTGFDPRLLNTTEGIGISSVHSRISALNGEFELDSAPGKGVEITINLNIKTETHSNQ